MCGGRGRVLTRNVTGVRVSAPVLAGTHQGQAVSCPGEGTSQSDLFSSFLMFFVHNHPLSIYSMITNGGFPLVSGSELPADDTVQWEAQPLCARSTRQSTQRRRVQPSHPHPSSEPRLLAWGDDRAQGAVAWRWDAPSTGNQPHTGQEPRATKAAGAHLPAPPQQWRQEKPRPAGTYLSLRGTGVC